MKRIGIAASKMAKGNFVLYNLYVVLISILFSLFIYVVSGSSIVLALITIYYIINGVMPLEFESTWGSMFYLCMATLTVIVSIINLVAN